MTADRSHKIHPTGLAKPDAGGSDLGTHNLNQNASSHGDKDDNEFYYPSDTTVNVYQHRNHSGDGVNSGLEREDSAESDAQTWTYPFPAFGASPRVGSAHIGASGVSEESTSDQEMLSREATINYSDQLHTMTCISSLLAILSLLFLFLLASASSGFIQGLVLLVLLVCAMQAFIAASSVYLRFELRRALLPQWHLLSYDEKSMNRVGVNRLHIWATAYKLLEVACLLIWLESYSITRGLLQHAYKQIDEDITWIYIALGCYCLMAALQGAICTLVILGLEKVDPQQESIGAKWFEKLEGVFGLWCIGPSPQASDLERC